MAFKQGFRVQFPCVLGLEMYGTCLTVVAMGKPNAAAFQCNFPGHLCVLLPAKIHSESPNTIKMSSFIVSLICDFS